MARAVTVGTTVYRTATDARNAVREFIAASQLDAPLTGREEQFALDLLSSHPHEQAKRGVGIEHISVRVNLFMGGRNRCFWIKRTDGSEVDFSWMECLKPSSHVQRVRCAMRTAVQRDVYAFKVDAFRKADVLKCEITGEPLRLGEADVHHVPPFVELVEGFLNGSYDDVVVDSGMSATQIGDQLVDNVLEAAWVEYHKQNAGLKIVSRNAHRRLKKQ